MTKYRAAQDLHQQSLRQGILDDASNLLMREGASALTMRRIAQTVGCSTTVLYTMFGNKQGLADELYLRGFEILRQTLELVEYPGNSLDYLLALGRAYREFALKNSTYYSLMFLKVIPEYTPSESNRNLGLDSSKFFVQAVQDCIEPGEEPESEAWEIARIIWANLHGNVSLELAGYSNYQEPSEQRFERALQVLVNGLLSPKQENRQGYSEI